MALYNFCKASVNRRTPENTINVPIQCPMVNGFLKYRIENIKLINFLKVITNVTTREGHSVVKMKTPLIQTYLREEMLRKYR